MKLKWDKSKLHNAAFGTTTDERREEQARIVREVLAKMAQGRTEGKLIDYNGNTVGTWKA